MRVETRRVMEVFDNEGRRLIDEIAEGDEVMLLNQYGRIYSGRVSHVAGMGFEYLDEGGVTRYIRYDSLEMLKKKG